MPFWIPDLLGSYLAVLLVCLFVDYLDIQLPQYWFVWGSEILSQPMLLYILIFLSICLNKHFFFLCKASITTVCFTCRPSICIPQVSGPGWWLVLGVSNLSKYKNFWRVAVSLWNQLCKLVDWLGFMAISWLFNSKLLHLEMPFLFSCLMHSLRSTDQQLASSKQPGEGVGCACRVWTELSVRMKALRTSLKLS